MTEWAFWGDPTETYEPYVEMCARGPESVRVLGECWGMSRLNHPAPAGRLLLSGEAEGAVVAGRRVSWASAARDSVRCALGATYDEIHAFLRHTGKVLENQPGFSGLTIAGNMGTGGHGSGLGLGPLGSMVRKVVLGSVASGGPEASYERGDPDFDYVVTHLGRLGPVLAMELDVVDAFRIAEERRIFVLGRGKRAWRAELPLLLQHAVHLQADPTVHSAEIWISPYTVDGELTCALGIRRRTNEPPSEGTRPFALRSRALQALGHVAAVMIAFADPCWVKWALRRTVESTATKRVVMSAREGLDFGAPGINRMAAIEAAIDISDGIDRAARAVVRVVDELSSMAEHRRYVFSPIGVRFVGEGPKGGLSPHAGRRRTMHLEVPTFAEDSVFHGDEVLSTLQRTLASPEFDGRPHWGQRIELTAEELQRLWPASSIDRMRELVHRLDGDNKFANPFLDAVLGIR